MDPPCTWHRILSLSRNFLFGPAKVSSQIQPLGAVGEVEEYINFDLFVNFDLFINFHLFINFDFFVNFDIFANFDFLVNFDIFIHRLLIFYCNWYTCKLDIFIKSWSNWSLSVPLNCNFASCPIYLDINIILCDTFWSFLTPKVSKVSNYNHNYHSHFCRNHCYLDL